MKVEIWSDIVCPFCYIGKRRFESALTQFEHRHHVHVVYRSFELDPTASHDAQSIHDVLAAKYGVSREQAEKMTANVAAQAKEDGLDFRFETMKRTNTFDAHRLIHFAAQYNKDSELIEQLYKAYFSDSKNIADRKTLIDLAQHTGMERDETENILTTAAFSDEVRKDEQQAQSLGINGVPFFLLNEQLTISGAQRAEVFVDTLHKAWQL